MWCLYLLCTGRWIFKQDHKLMTSAHMTLSLPEEQEGTAFLPFPSLPLNLWDLGLIKDHAQAQMQPSSCLDKATLSSLKSCSPNFITILGTLKSHKEWSREYDIHSTSDPNTTSALRTPQIWGQKLYLLPFHPGVYLSKKQEHRKC